MGVGKEREGEERNVDRLGLERKGVDGRKGECEGKVVAVRSQKPNVARTIREKVGTEKERKERRSGKGMGSEGVKEGKKDRNGEGEGTKGESWNSKGRKVKVLERKGIGKENGTNVGESGKIGMEGKRMGKRKCTMVEAQRSQNPERWILESRVGKKGTEVRIHVEWEGKLRVEWKEK